MKYKSRLLSLLRKKAVKKRKVRLASGKISDFYVDGRLITLDPEGAFLIASIILEMIKGKGIDAVGGPTIGADPITGAVACLAYIKNIPLKTFIVRKTQKEHGMKRKVEGPAIKKGTNVVLVDDVATTGGSLIEAKKVLAEIGVKAGYAIVVVDRQEGAEKNLEEAGCKLLSIFKKKDLTG